MTTWKDLRQIPARPLTHTTYSPYGTVLSPPEDVEPVTGESFTAAWWRVVNLEVIDGTLEVVYAQMPRRAYQLRKFERHMLVSQAFIPLQGHAFVQVVARPNNEDAPNPATVRAFIIDGTVGVLLHPGTWHVELFPIGAIGNFLVITRAETSQALAAQDMASLVGDTDIWDVPADARPEIVLAG